MADVVDATPGVVETAPDAGAEHKYVFNVSMSCGGCSGAVDRVLKKLEGTVSPFPSSTTYLPSAPVLTWLRPLRRQILRGLARHADGDGRGRGVAAVCQGAQDDCQDGQEGQQRRGRRRGAEC